VAKLNAAINESLKSAEIGNTLTKLSVDARISSPEEFAAFLARERNKWTAVIKTAGVQAE
jgi:tripartite-type tricarboxylate transporter receptor subunit TctC